MITGKIVLVPFPFDDLSESKVRPAVCLTEPAGLFHHTVVAFVTSKVPPDIQPSDLVIDPSNPGYEQTGLRFVSTVRLHRLNTVNYRLIERELGEMPSTTMVTVAQKLRTLFHLA